MLLEHKQHFFDKLKYYHLENGKLFVHAGFNPALGFKETLKKDSDQLLLNRTLFKWAYNRWKQKDKVKKIKSFGDFKTIYIGHTPSWKFNLELPIRTANVINLDQGAKHGYPLSIFCDETGTVYHGENAR